MSPTYRLECENCGWYAYSREIPGACPECSGARVIKQRVPDKKETFRMAKYRPSGCCSR